MIRREDGWQDISAKLFESCYQNKNTTSINIIIILRNPKRQKLKSAKLKKDFHENLIVNELPVDRAGVEGEKEFYTISRFRRLAKVDKIKAIKR